MKYEIINKILNQGQLIGYKLVQVGNPQAQPMFLSVEGLLHSVGDGIISVQGVKITKSGKLRGCDGFLLSKVSEVSIKNLSVVNADLLEVLTYVMKQIFPRPHKSTTYGTEIKGLTAYCFVDTRSEDYYNMTHMDATDDLLGSLEFYQEHLPKELEGKIDDLSGEVGEKGYLRITVSKKLEI